MRTALAADLNLIVDPEDPGHSLAAIQAELLLMESIHAAPQSHYSSPGVNVEMPQFRDVLANEVSCDTLPQVSVSSGVGGRKSWQIPWRAIREYDGIWSTWLCRKKSEGDRA